MTPPDSRFHIPLQNQVKVTKNRQNRQKNDQKWDPKNDPKWLKNGFFEK
jgi:hypothetical protein